MKIQVYLFLLLSSFTTYVTAQTQRVRTRQDTGRVEAIVKPVESLPLVVAKLATFKQLITPENYRGMGFTSPDEINTATIDPPIQDFMIRLDRLKSYAPGTDPNDLLIATGQQIFPIKVGEEVRSSMTLKPILFFWKALSYGSPQLIRLITGIRDENAARMNIPRSAYALVRIPAMNLMFLSYRSNNILYFVSLIDDRKQRFRAGESQPAERILTLILPEAREHDGLPR